MLLLFLLHLLKIHFKDHIDKLCKKASQKLNTLARVASYICLEKGKQLWKHLLTSQFGYCPLVWMFRSRGFNNKINSLHERVLRITYGDRSSSFQELFKKDNSVSIHHRNIQALALRCSKLKIILHRIWNNFLLLKWVHMTFVIPIHLREGE